MTLKADAQRLCSALETIVKGLETYDKDDRRDYTKALAASLRMRVRNFREAIDESRSREQAKEVLEEMTELMYEVNGAATKGEIDFVSGKVLATYWQLRTIFREARFRDEPL